MIKLNKKKILFITGNRADFGLLSGLIKKIQNNKKFQTNVLALSQHNSKEFGKTFSEIKADKIRNII